MFIFNSRTKLNEYLNDSNNDTYVKFELEDRDNLDFRYSLIHDLSRLVDAEPTTAEIIGYYGDHTLTNLRTEINQTRKKFVEKTTILEFAGGFLSTYSEDYFELITDQNNNIEKLIVNLAQEENLQTILDNLVVNLNNNNCQLKTLVLIGINDKYLDEYLSNKKFSLNKVENLEIRKHFLSTENAIKLINNIELVNDKKLQISIESDENNINKYWGLSRFHFRKFKANCNSLINIISPDNSIKLSHFTNFLNSDFIEFLIPLFIWMIAGYFVYKQNSTIEIIDKKNIFKLPESEKNIFGKIFGHFTEKEVDRKINDTLIKAI